MKRSRALVALLAGVAVVAVAIVGYTAASASIHASDADPGVLGAAVDGGAQR